MQFRAIRLSRDCTPCFGRTIIMNLIRTPHPSPLPPMIYAIMSSARGCSYELMNSQKNILPIIFEGEGMRYVVGGGRGLKKKKTGTSVFAYSCFDCEPFRKLIHARSFAIVLYIFRLFIPVVYRVFHLRRVHRVLFLNIVSRSDTRVIAARLRRSLAPDL